jgi:hypothetical protein
MLTAAATKPPQNVHPVPIPAFDSNRSEMLTTLNIAAVKGFKRLF